MAEPIGERMTRVETKMEALKEGQAAIMHRLDAGDQAAQSMAGKLDLILANQAEGSKDRAAIREEISQMKPDVQTVAEAKRIWKYGRWLFLAAGASATAIAGMKGWIILNWNFLWGITPR